MYIYIFKYFKLYRILKNALQNCYYYFILHIKLAALVLMHLIVLEFHWASLSLCLESYVNEH